MTTLVFSATDFSTWALGAPTDLNFRWDALRIEVNQDVSQPLLGTNGAGIVLDGNVSGFAALGAELQLGLGGASVTYGVAVDAPSDTLFLNAPIAFDTSGFSVVSGGMTTTGPDPRGGSFRLGLEYELNAAVEQVRLDIPLEWAGVQDPAAPIDGLSWSTGRRYQDLFRIEGEDLDPIHATLIPGLLNGSLQLPSRVDTGTSSLVAGADALPDLVSEGASAIPFADISLDIDGAISQLLASLGLPIQLEGSLEVNTPVFNLDLAYTILHAAAVLNLKFGQRFTFDPSHIEVRLETEFGDVVTGRLGDDFAIPTPDGGWGTMEVEATYRLAGSFRNQSGVVASALIEHDWFAGNIGLTVFGQATEEEPGQNYDTGLSFGPLFSGRFPSAEGWDFAEFYLYDNSFAVGGAFAPVTETYLVNWENFWEGTPDADIRTLTPHQVEMDALGGDDRITGNDLDNAITLGGGADTATGVEGDDLLLGGEGDDTLEGGEGNDTLDGGPGTDRALFLGGGDVTVVLDAQGDGTAADGLGGLDALVSIEQVTTGDGNDVVALQSAGDNRVETGAGDDSVLTGGGQDVVFAGAGADTLELGEGNDWADGAEGADSIAAGAGRDTVLGGSEADTLAGGEGDDVLDGQEGDDVLAGEAGADSLAGRAGDDLLEGGEGADTLDGGIGADTLAGGEDGDLLRFAAVTTGVVLNLSTETVEGAGGVAVLSGTARDGAGAVDLVSGFESIEGSDHDDLLVAGTTEELRGGLGADTLVGGSGAHAMVGGAGDDTYVVRRADQVVVEGGPMTDRDHVISHVDFSLGATPLVEDLTLVGAARLGTGNGLANRLVGTAGGDTLEGANGADTFIGGDGDDVFIADGGDDRFEELAGGGRDTLRLVAGSAAPATFDGTLNGAGEIEDFILLATGARNVLGNARDNLITDNAANNRLEGREGNDTLSVTTGLDTVHGGAGSDRLVVNYADVTGVVLLGSGNGPIGEDTATGGLQGTVFLNFSRHVDFTGIESFTLATGSAADSLRTGAGADSISSGAGNDTINVGTGADTVDAGTGNDYLTATVEGGDAARSLNLDSDEWQDLGSLRMREVEGISLRWLGDGSRDITTSAVVSRTDVITSFGGDDTFRGGLGEDTWAAGAGDDLLILDYSSTSTVVFLGSGNGNFSVDALNGGYAGRVFQDNGRNTSFSGVERFHLATGSGSDNLRTGIGADSISSGAGNDTINVGTGADTVDAGTGNDYLAATVEGGDAARSLMLDSDAWQDLGSLQMRDVEGVNLRWLGNGSRDITTSALVTFNDVITSFGGNDTFRGGLGEDTWAAGAGDDLLILDYSSTSTVVFLGSGNGSLALDTVTGGYAGRVFQDNGRNTSFSGVERFHLATGSGWDNLRTGIGADSISSGAGNDTINVGTGADTVDAGTGNDYLAATVEGGDGARSLNLDSDAWQDLGSLRMRDVEGVNLRWLGNGSRDITTSALVTFNDVITSSGGNDTFRGGLGEDTWAAGVGDDLLILDYSSTSTVVFLGSGNGSLALDTVTGGYAGRVFQDNGRNTSFSGVERFHLATGSGSDNLRTGIGADSIVSGGGNDTINSGTGADTVDAGTGNDYLAATVEGGDGARSLMLDSDAWQDLGSLQMRDVEGVNLRWLGNGSRDITTSALVTFNDVITSFGGNDTFRGGLGEDTWAAGVGDDLLILDYSSTSTVVFLGSGNGSLALDTVTGGYAGRVFQDNGRNTSFSGVERFHLATGGGSDNLRTGIGADSISSGAGNDTINVGSGADTVDAGTGNDYLAATVDGAQRFRTLDLRSDAWQDLGSAKVRSIEGVNLVWLGNGRRDVITSATVTFNDVVTTGGGNDTFRGGLGLDNWAAGSGNDLLVLNYGSATGSVSLGTGNGDLSTDTVTGGYAGRVFQDFGRYTFFSGVERFHLTSGSASDNLRTGDWNDTIIAGAGNDTVNAGSGDDWVDLGSGGGSAQGGLGFDTLLLALGTESQALLLDVTAGQMRRGGSAHVTFSGFERFSVTAGSGADSLRGGDAADTLRGGEGADTLEGGIRDLLEGGGGDDAYIVAVRPVRIVEADGGGHDRVLSTTTFTLVEHVEELHLIGPLALRGNGNASDNLIVGNELDNALRGENGADTLLGGAGRDRLDGGAGVDRMEGGTGPDVYVVDDPGDVVVEVDESGVSDLVIATADFVLPDFVERLRLDGTAPISGTGNALGNVIGGNDAANLISGGGGNDILVGNGGDDTLLGGTGSDRMRGGAGADLFLFDAPPGDGVELILDFQAGLDRLGFDAAAFPLPGTPGVLAAELFHAGSTATTAAQRILYDQATRGLYFDEDGSGLAAPVLLATVRGGPPPGAADLWLV